MQDDEFIKQVESTTGKTILQWFALLADSGVEKFGDLIKGLQNKYGLEYRTAHDLTLMYLKYREENAPQLRYTSQGRAGTVHYITKETSFDMWYEFAGGNALAI